MTAKLISLCCAVILVLHPRPLTAQDTAVVDLTKVLQFSIPSSPALKLLDATAEEITRPTSLKELAASILSGVDAQGRFQQGVAIEAAPIQLAHRTMDRAWYRRNLLLANIGLSIASTKAATDDASTNFGVGLRTVLLDRTNPIASAKFERAALQALRDCRDRFSESGQPVHPDSFPKVVECVTVADTAIGNRFRREHWNDYAITAGGARGWSLRNSQWDQRESFGWQTWTTIAGPICLSTTKQSSFCRSGQWLIEGQYVSRETTFDSPEPIKQFALGARGTWGSDVIGLFAEYLSLNRRAPAPGVRKRVGEQSGGVEFRVGENLWVSSGAGTRYNDAIGDSQVVLVANLRFNLTSDRKLAEVVPRQ